MFRKNKNLIRILVVGSFLLIAGLTFWIVASYVLPQNNVAPQDTSASSCEIDEIVNVAFSGTILTQNDFAFIISPVVNELDTYQYTVRNNDSATGLYVSTKKDEVIYVFRAKDCLSINEGLAQIVKIYPKLKPAQ